MAYTNGKILKIIIVEGSEFLGKVLNDRSKVKRINILFTFTNVEGGGGGGGKSLKLHAHHT